MRLSSLSHTDVTITDNGEGTGTTTWTCDKNYILDGYIFVNGGQALTIEAGTIVKVPQDLVWTLPP